MSSLGVNTGPPLPLQCHKNCPKEMRISIFGKSEKFQNCNMAVTSVHIIMPTAGKDTARLGDTVGGPTPTPGITIHKHMYLSHYSQISTKFSLQTDNGHTMSTWPKIVPIGNSRWHPPTSYICTFGHISVANEHRPNCTKIAVQILIYLSVKVEVDLFHHCLGPGRCQVKLEQANYSVLLRRNE